MFNQPFRKEFHVRKNGYPELREYVYSPLRRDDTTGRLYGTIHVEPETRHVGYCILHRHMKESEMYHSFMVWCVNDLLESGYELS